jgi:signal transduction histidine kinase
MPPDTDLERGRLPLLGVAAIVATLVATAAGAVFANRLLVHDRASSDRQRADATAARVQAAVRRSVGATESLQFVVNLAPTAVQGFADDANHTVGLADARAQAVLLAGVAAGDRGAFAARHPGLDVTKLAARPGLPAGPLLFPALAVAGSGPLPGRPGVDAGSDPALLTALLANSTHFQMVVSPRGGGGVAGPGAWLVEATNPPDAVSATGYVAAFFPALALLGPDAAYAALQVGTRAIDPGAHPRKPLARSFDAAGETWTVLVARRSLSVGARLAPAAVVLFGVVVAMLVWLALGGVVRRHREAMSLERRRGERRVLAERAAEEERRRIARELHDSISQALFSMSLQVRTASVALEREDVDPRSPLARAVGELARLTRGALAEIRALIFELRPEGLREEGLVAALRKHAAAVAARAGVPLELELPEQPLPLDPGVEEELYRVAQEAIHNAVRHADATRITLAAGLDPERGIWLEIADDGRGFDPGLERPGHLGLRNMAERAARAGGDLSIDSAPGAGTRVRLSLPLVAAGAGR